MPVVIFTAKALGQMKRLEADRSKKNVLNAVRKTFSLMEANLRHPSLATHEFHGLEGPDGEKVFEAYAQNNTSGAYRIFWYYGIEKGTIIVASIVPHP